MENGALFEWNIQKQPPEVFHKKGILKNFAKFTGKPLYPSLFYKKVAGLIIRHLTSLGLVISGFRDQWTSSQYT